jgi:hypothetical protein
VSMKPIVISEKDAKRFFSRINLGENECWNWQGSSKKGYGVFIAMANGNKNFRAHRWSYAYLTKEDISDAVICHLCHNTLCVNPLHLYAGTPADNNRDTALAGRNHNQKKTHCTKGHEFTKENTRYKRGRRNCQECGKDRWRKLDKSKTPSTEESAR